MGADLLGFMVRGPKTLNIALVEPAVEDLTSRKAVLEIAYTSFRDAADAAAQHDDGEDPLMEELYDLLERLFPEFEVSFFGMEHMDAIETIIAMSAIELVDNLLYLWATGSARDCTYRDFEEQRVMFCGEMSWGDEPDGHGYETLKHAQQLGLLGALGIE